MTPQQEKKLDDVYAICLETNGRFNVIDEKLSQHREAILDHEKMFVAEKERVDSLEADRNKVKGVILVTSTGFFASVVAFVISIFRGH